MKRIVLLFILLYSHSLYAFNVQHFHRAVLAAKNTEAGGLCSGLDANAVFYLDFDYDTGDTDTKRRTACIVSSTLVGTLTTATITSGQNHTSGGTYALYGDGSAAINSITFSNSGGEFLSTEGFIEFWIYPTSVSDDNRIFSAVSGADYARIWIETNSKIKFYFDGQGVVSDLESTDTITINAWNHIEVRWDTATNEIGVQINSGDWDSKSDVAISTWSSEPSEFLIGSYLSTDIFAGYIDDVQIWKTYDKSAP